MQRYILSQLLMALFFVVMISCDKSKETGSLAKKKSDSIIVYNDDEYAELGGYEHGNKKKFNIIDTPYISAEKNAKTKAKNGVYIYYFGAGIGMSSDKAEYIKKGFLTKGIHIDFYYSTCIPLREGPFKNNCNEDAMNAEFKKKYGAAFIDLMQKDLELFYREYHDKKYLENQ